MDTRLRCKFLIAVIVIFASLFLNGADCQVYSWSVSVPLNITICNGSSPLNLNWTFSPETPGPRAIEWIKQGTSGTFDNIATFISGNFTPSAAYTGRVSRTGSTAEIAIQGPLTAVDGGVYRVSVTDSGGLQITADANVIVPVLIVPIRASCQATDAGSFTVACAVEVSAPVTLQLRNSTAVIKSGSSASEFQTPISNPENLTFQCSVTGDGSECVTPNTADVTCVPAPEPDECGFPLIAVIILAILLVVKVVTDVLFVLYRWGGFFKGISVKKVYVLYWSCFVQGIVDCVVGVIFFIVTLAAYTECLDELLAIVTLVLSIIVTIIGGVDILLCCFCYKPPGEVDGKPGSSEPSSNAGGPRPWLCCLKPQTKISSGEESRQSPPAPIPAAMASPRKPVPPNSTSARPLPSPTSDPASDSAVNPKVLLEPLNVEEPKKKKKRRKKRKSTKEAAEESTEQTMTAAGDSDDD